ncbi:hypothetical protein GCM10009504_24440 [Pseudomonas laurentiana]|nr:hypothetical protein GCM10009504_24440 [Pseudomonas laurentiana]
MTVARRMTVAGVRIMGAARSMAGVRITGAVRSMAGVRITAVVRIMAVVRTGMAGQIATGTADIS